MDGCWVLPRGYGDVRVMIGNVAVISLHAMKGHRESFT